MKKSPFRLATVLLTAALALTACGSNSSTADSTASASDGSEITIEHAYGTTTIPEKPERIATVAWANHEVPLALGVVPVGMAKATWGDDDGDGMLPWVEEKIKELGGDTPVLFDETDGLPLEEIADTNPDVILASYSGLTQEEYDALSRIAPTVAFPDTAWSTTYEQMISLNSAAMGMADEGKALISKLRSTVDETFAKYSDLAGKKVLFTAFGSEDPSTVGFYTTHDPREGFLIDNGMAAPQVVADESAKSDQFWVSVSAENPELFDDVDLVVTYGSDDAAENAKTLATLQADPLLGKIKAIASGHVVFLGNLPLAASANPSPLSIDYTLDNYLATLNKGLSN